MARRVIEGKGTEFLTRQGLAARPEVWEDAIRTGGKRGLFEWWYFDATLENGVTLGMVFFTRPLLQRKDPLTPSIAVVIRRPGLPRRRWMVSFPSEAFTAAKDRCDVRIADNWVRGDLDIYTIHIALDEVAVDLELTGQVEPWRPDAGISFYDEALEAFFAWLVPVPLGKVEGQLRLDGEEQPLQGTGYHDHNWGNVDLNRVLSHWYWGRFHIPPYMGIFVEMTATPAYGRQHMPIVMLAREEQVIFEMGTGHVRVETAGFWPHPSGHRYPTRLAWHAEEGERRVHIGLEDPELTENYSFLETLPSWKRLAARLLGKNPYYLRFHAQTTLDLHLHEGRETLSGPVLYEIMYLS